jgi:hypothetical protein
MTSSATVFHLCQLAARKCLREHRLTARSRLLERVDAERREPAR